MKIGPYEYTRCSVKVVCPVCGKSKWCMISCNGEYVLCTSVEEGSIRKWKTGYLHRLKESYDIKKLEKKKPVKAWDGYSEFLYRYMNRDLDQLVPMAKNLKVAPEVMADLGCAKMTSCAGEGKNKDVWCFPMRDVNGAVIGLKCRDLDRNKWCTIHSKLGLYIPKSVKLADPLFICEGESDTAACLSIGLNVIGRPSVNAGQDLLVAFASNRRVILFADTDKTAVGLKEATKLLGKFKAGSRILYNEQYKDVREWIQQGGATKATFDAMI